MTALQYYFISLPLTAVSSLTIGAFVLFKNPKNPVNRSWFLMSSAVGLWAMFIFLSFWTSDYAQGLLFSRLCNLFAAYIPLFFVQFCLELTGQKSKRRMVILRLGYLSALFITMFAFTDYFENVKSISIFKFYADPGPIFYYFTFHFFALSGYAEYLLLSSLKLSSPVKRNQVLYIVAATSIGFIVGGSTFLPVYNIPINPIPTHFVWLYTAIISYAIVKHGLMDITIIFRKGLVYSLLIGLVTAVYFLVIFLTSLLFQNLVGYKSWGVVLLLSTIIALCFKPMERRLQFWVDRLIFKKTPGMIEKENERLRLEVQNKDKMQAVATLAAGMAHEIKNPLTTIRTFAEYLPTKFDDPDFRQKFQRIIVDEVDRVNNIVKQLLEFSKPGQLNLKPILITEVLDETLELLSNNLLKHKIGLIKNYAADPKILADKNQLKQVFLNLFLNAIQAMPHGGTLSVDCRRQTTPARQDLLPGRADYCLLTTISDTGIGIPKEQLPHIFDPFFTTKESGTGLGLSIVHGIIQEHGGKIEVTSSPGKGTEFRILLK